MVSIKALDSPALAGCSESAVFARRPVARVATLAAVVLAGCAGAEVTLTEARQSAVCALGDRLGRLDIIPSAGGGLSLRIVTLDPPRALAAINETKRRQRPTGLTHVRIDPPRPMLAIVLHDVEKRPDQLRAARALGHALTYALRPDDPRAKDYAEWLARLGNSVLSVQLDPSEGTPLSARPSNSIPESLGIMLPRGLTSVVPERDTVARLAGLPAGTLVAGVELGEELVKTARAKGLSTTSWTVVLDLEPGQHAIERQLLVALGLAEQHGAAVAFAHARPETMSAIHAFMDRRGDALHIVGVERVGLPATKPLWLRQCGDVERRLAAPSEGGR